MECDALEGLRRKKGCDKRAYANVVEKLLCVPPEVGDAGSQNSKL